MEDVWAQSLERNAILQRVLLHFAGTAIHEVILEEELGHPCLLTAPVVYWQCMLIEMLEGPGIVNAPAYKGFQFVAFNTALTQNC